MAYVLDPSGVPRFFRADGVEHWLVPGPTCPQCNAPIPPTFRICDYCEQTSEFETSILTRIVASTLYIPDERPPWPHNRELVELKQEGAHAVAFAQVLADLLAQKVLDPDTFDVIVPVPPTTRRERSGPRALAQALAGQVNIPHQDALDLTRSVEPQKSLKRDRRFANVAGAMRADASVAGARVLLVDDIATTCATLFEAARALAEQGASSCVGAVAGRHTSGQDLRQAGHCVWVD